MFNLIRDIWRNITRVTVLPNKFCPLLVCSMKRTKVFSLCLTWCFKHVDAVSLSLLCHSEVHGKQFLFLDRTSSRYVVGFFVYILLVFVPNI